MALRAPTTYARLGRHEPKDEIEAADYDAALDDQQYALDRGECLVSVVGLPYYTDSDSWVTFGRVSVRGRDLCGTAGAGTETAKFCMQACSYPVAVNFVVGLFDPGLGDWVSYTVVANQGTMKWRGWTVDDDELSIPTDGTVYEYLIGAKVSVYSGALVLLRGLGIFVANPT